MFTIGLLIVLPLVVALILLLTKGDTLRNAIVKVAASVLAVASIYLLAGNIGMEVPKKYNLDFEMINYLIILAELFLTAIICWQGVKYKKFGVVALAVAQFVFTVYIEFFLHKIHIENNLVLDNLSIIMALLIGIIGSLICVFALGYMKNYHHHKNVKDRSNYFFFILFVFLSAMFGLIFSNNLIWILFFWEITTFCSFLLIGYTRTSEAKQNAFRALFMNLIGGFAFIIAIYILHNMGIAELDKLLAINPMLIALPIALISIAGITKSAQIPFSSWLLGAMVAPTPVSALLHSSTMVKAGVYILIRLSPIMEGTLVGSVVSLLGAITFFIASCIAVSQQNVKKILAYSTIANLGLIVTCAGVGTYQAVWTAIFLTIFHAVAKSLLFLCVGTIEHGIDSLDVEDMDGLVMKMPKVAAFLLVGIAGMFIAPFGMLISKWAALETLISVNPILAIIVAFGSAVTLFFWTKWMGKIIMIIHPVELNEEFVSKDEWFTLGTLSVLTVIVCITFPWISSGMVDPYTQHIYQHTFNMDRGNILIMLGMLALIMLLPLRLLFQGKEIRHVSAYLCGSNITENSEIYQASQSFHGAAGTVKELGLNNYYLQEYFGEDKYAKVGTIIGVLLIIILLGVTFIR